MRTTKTMKTTMMTDRTSTDAARLVRKAVKARMLTDPLGAKGFRSAAERIERERRSRRLTFVAALAAFSGAFGLIAATAPDAAPPPTAPSAQTVQQSSIIAEIPIPSTNPNEPDTIVRVLLPSTQVAPEVRTQAS